MTQRRSVAAGLLALAVLFVVLNSAIDDAGTLFLLLAGGLRRRRWGAC